MVSIRPLISKSSSPCINPLVTVVKAPITIRVILTFMFHSFFNSLARARYLSFFSLSFNYILWSARTAKSTIRQVSFFLFLFFFFFFLIITRSGRLAEIRWTVCISKSLRSLRISFFRTDSGLCIYHLFAWSNPIFLHNSQWITLPTQSCLALYSFCANLPHLLICDWAFLLLLLSLSFYIIYIYIYIYIIFGNWF